MMNVIDLVLLMGEAGFAWNWFGEEILRAKNGEKS